MVVSDTGPASQQDTLPPEAPPEAPPEPAAEIVDDHGRTLGVSVSAPSAELGEPTHIGRHIVIAKLGAGGMGIVYAAYDPELDRKLAIKLIRPGRDRADSHDRMLREAQAMAKVSHPNVIAIYDVGSFAGQIYIAMEFVAGGNLGDWLATRPAKERRWEEVLGLFRQAGQALAAAHEAGLVHRDFKPDNVLVGDDGRVRVVDFGLARGIDQADPEASGLVHPRVVQAPMSTLASASVLGSATQTRSSMLGRELTRVGALIGTPAYMPPEHIAGRRGDARADQFSFCVSLWEALYGERPFAGVTLPELFDAALDGRVALVSAERRAAVPEWLHAVVLRGLASEPARRWADMRALLAALDPPRSRLRWWLAGSLLLVAGAGLAVVGGRAEDEAPRACSGFEQRLAGIWDDARRAALTAAFTRTGRQYAGRSAQVVTAILDTWTAGWVAMRGDACEATEIRKEQSSALLDLRMTCLDQRLTEVDALVGVFIRAEPEVLEHAVEAASELEDLRGCGDSERLLGGPARPSDPAVAARVDALAAQLTAIEALAAAGQPRQAATELAALAGPITEAAWPALTARMLLARGRLEAELDAGDANQTLLEAVAVALELGDDHLLATALTDLVWVQRYELARAAELDRWALLLRAVLRRVDAPLLAATMHQALGKSQWERGEYTAAVAELDAAIALREQHLGPGHLKVIESRQDLAAVLMARGDLDGARAILVAARERYVAELGPDHPLIAGIDNRMGAIAWKVGDYDAALTFFARGLDIRERALGPEHPGVIALIDNIGATHGMKGDFTRATQYFARSVATLRKQGDSTLLASSLDNLAAAETKGERLDAARTLYLEAYELRKRLLPADHPDLARSLVNIAQLDIETGRAARARELLEQALALREHVEVDQVVRARARWQLAEALDRLGQQRGRIRELLIGAQQDYAVAGMKGGELKSFEKAALRLLGKPLPPPAGR